MHNVAYIPTFMTNVISLDILASKGTHWSTRKPEFLESETTGHFYMLHKDGGHWCITEFNPQRLALLVVRDIRKRPIKSRTALELHRLLGHVSPETIKHATEAFLDIQVDSKEACPATNECDVCGLAKGHSHISTSNYVQLPEDGTPFDRIGFDLIPMDIALNGDNWVSHLYCRQYHFHMVETHRNKSDCFQALKNMATLANRLFKAKIRFIRLDGETALGPEFTEWRQDEGIQIEQTPPHTAEPRGLIERAGRSLTERARCLKIAANLPNYLWKELYKVSAFLLNRTPVKSLGWITPWEAVTGNKPSFSYVEQFGCKAYATIKKIPKLQRLELRAYIGYLVGWDATDIYRIWLPSKHKIIRTRDVIFSKEVYNPTDLDASAVLNDKDTLNIVETIQLAEENDGQADELGDSEQVFPLDFNFEDYGSTSSTGGPGIATENFENPTLDQYHSTNESITTDTLQANQASSSESSHSTLTPNSSILGTPELPEEHTPISRAENTSPGNHYSDPMDLDQIEELDHSKTMGINSRLRPSYHYELVPNLRKRQNDADHKDEIDSNIRNEYILNTRTRPFKRPRIFAAALQQNLSGIYQAYTIALELGKDI